MKKGICTLITIVFIAVMVSTAYAVSQPVIYTSSLPKGVINQGYGAEIATKTDEAAVIEWIIVDGSLPDGLTLDRYDQDGLRDALGYYHGWINGIPTKTGTFSFTVQAAPVGYPNLATTRNYSITITEGEESSITTYSARSLGTATVGEEFSLSLTSLGKYKFFSGGELPEGLSMSSTNIVDSEGRFITTIEGTPTQEGTYKFFITTCNKNNLSTYSSATSHGWRTECIWKVYPMILTVKPAGNVQSANVQNVGISAQPVPSGTIVTPKDFPSLSGGRTPIGLEGAEYASGQFTSTGSIIGVIDGVLPDGLQYSASESAIIGTPTKAGIYTAIIAAKGSSSLATARPVTIAIDECISPDIPAQTLSSGKAREAYSETIEFTGSQPAILVVTNGILPEGLSLDVSGRISGTPSKSGTYEFTVEAVNFSGRAERKVMIVIEADTDIAIKAENFPDETFRKYVTNNFDSDSNGYLSEAEIPLITEIYVNNKGITSLKGIEYFVNLRELYCNNNVLTELDITSNTELTTLYCKGNSIASIDIRNCPNLNDFVHDNTAEIIDGTSEPAPDPYPEPEVVPEFKTQSVLLSGQIGLNFYMNLPEIDGVDYADKDCYMDFSINGSTKDNPPQMYDPEFMNASKKYYGFRCYINSIQMADPITATLHYGNSKAVDKVYSAKQYLDTILERDSFSAEMKAFAVSMKDYGHYMQVYLSQLRGWSIGKDHAEMDCVNVYTDADIAEAREAVQEYAINYDKGNSSIEKVTYSLNFDSEMAINIYLKPKTSNAGDTETPEIGDDDTEISDGVSAFLDGGTQNLAVLQTDGRYKVQIAGISAHKLAKTYTVTVHAGEIFDIKISAFSYANALLKSASSSSAVKKAVTSMYRYYTATMVYRKSKGYTD